MSHLLVMSRRKLDLFAKANLARFSALSTAGALNGIGLGRADYVAPEDPAVDAAFEEAFGEPTLTPGEYGYEGEGSTVEGRSVRDIVSGGANSAPYQDSPYASGNQPYSYTSNRIGQATPATSGASYNGVASDIGDGVGQFFSSFFKGIVGTANAEPRRTVQPVQKPFPWGWVVGGVGAVVGVGALVAVLSKKSK